MELTREEEKALNGEQGEALAIAYKILLAIGESTDARRLVPIRWAHVSGVNYNTIGDAGVEFLEEFSQTARTSVRTTINPMGFDPAKPDSHNLKKSFVSQQHKIVDAYRRIGATESFTCIPYEVFDLPPAGSNVSFAESNAAVYANSIDGLRTNRESGLSALASSVTGKAPFSELRIEEMREPSKRIRIKTEMEDEVDYGLLGYFAGKVSKDVVALDGITTLGKKYAKSLCAAVGTSGSCGMFTLSGSGEEKIDFGRTEAASMKDELNTSEKGDIIALGSPQLGVDDLSVLSDIVNGRKFRKRCLIFCARAAYESATKLGYTEKIEGAGGNLLCDSCTCLTPLIEHDDVDSVITNSVKAAYYLHNHNKVDVSLRSLKEIVKRECE